MTFLMIHWKGTMLMTNNHKILREFLEIPNHTTQPVFDKFLEIPGAEKYGDGLCSFLYIPGKRSDRVVLVAHADTVWDENYSDNNKVDGISHSKNLVWENDRVRNESGGLGADDRAGCAILWLLQDLGHSILITDGEEGGHRGSDFLMESFPDLADELNQHQFMVQFDRRNGTDYKMYDVGTDEFRCYIEAVTGYSEPDRISSTDIKTLCRNIAGVNLSVGYNNEHNPGEYLNIREWENTLNVTYGWLSQICLPRFSLPVAVS